MNMLVNGVGNADQKGTVSLPLDLSQLKILFGQTDFTGLVNADRFFMQNDGSSCKFASLNQCKLEGKVIPASIDLSVESSFMRLETPGRIQNLKEIGVDPKSSR